MTTELIRAVNVNDYAEVTLTQKGAETLNAYNKEFVDFFLQRNINTTLKSKTDYREGDVFKQQMWCLFNIFGKDFALGGECPWKFCEMRIA